MAGTTDERETAPLAGAPRNDSDATMNLFAETRNALRWVFQILGQFLRVVPGVTLAVVACLTIARITRLLAFLLPLKVVLLAGSEGMPRFFRGFLSPDQREIGIAALSAAAIVAYGLTLFLEARSKRLSDSGGADLLSAAGVMAVVTNQREEIQGIYVRFTQIVSAVLFVAAGTLVLAALNPVLAAYLFGLILCFYLFTAWVLDGVTPLKQNRVAALIDKRFASYLGILSSVAFLSGFLVILYPFLTPAGGNVLVAIISIIVMRQATGALNGAIKDVVSLVQKRQIVDALVLPDRQFHQLEGADQRTLRALFGRQDRERLVADALAGLRRPDQSVHVEWLDPPTRGMAEFAIALQGGEAPARHFRQRVFPPRLGRMVENEDLLFRHVARDAVRAALVVTRFTHGEHECIVYDAGTGAAPTGSGLSAAHGAFIAALWSVEPPPALVRIYAASHKAMQDRLTDDLLARMDVAVDCDEAAATLERLREALPAIRAAIAALPLVLTNPAFARGQAVLDADGAVLVLGGWGEWTLEPMGANLPAPFANEGKLAALIAQARQARPASVDERIGREHLMLARRCGLLEKEIARGAMKAALALATQVLADLDAAERVPARDKEVDRDVA